MYNEEENAVKAIEAALPVLSMISPDYEIVVVDGGSKDRTVDIVRDLAEKNGRIRWVCQGEKRGLGHALRLGFAEADKELIVYSDADLPFEMKEIIPATELLERTKADVFCAYRTNREVDGFLRTVYSFIYNHLINMLFGVGVRDVNFSFKIFKGAAIKSILPELKSDGAFIDAEMLTVAKRKGFKIVQSGVKYFSRQKGKSTLSHPSVILKIIGEMVGFLMNARDSHVKKELLARYWKLNLWGRLHVNLRYRSCPFKTIERFVPKSGSILDFGCGHGLFTNYLALTSSKRKMTGMDLSKEKIEQARSCDGCPNIHYVQNPSADIPQEEFNAIVMVDVLYLLPYGEQKRLIAECVKQLGDSGALIVKEMSKRPRIKYLWNVFQETLAVKLFKITEGKGFYFRAKEDFESLFKDFGLKVEAHDLSEGYFHPHILFVCTK
jgi:glycosyltransferase involved in cell wall biosynthesis